MPIENPTHANIITEGKVIIGEPENESKLGVTTKGTLQAESRCHRLGTAAERTRDASGKNASSIRSMIGEVRGMAEYITQIHKPKLFNLK